MVMRTMSPNRGGDDVRKQYTGSFTEHLVKVSVSEESAKMVRVGFDTDIGVAVN